ncbi:response regulator [Desulfohalobiaceae bacterium Ax17]|uniref:response regulator n=1 Tax=Desulfovulcanus ferrireducens TaxID=2831190 RepID=UPI00207BB506|nr:response regulator [Desulfovulcanus ferrireducens]MBT8762777.1 response regulator [Desulfovulcanus ferrireducens]
MSSISITYGNFVHAETIADKIAQKLEYEIIDDNALFQAASKKFDMPVDKIRRAVFCKPSVFNKFTHEKERCVAFLKSILAEYLEVDNRLYFGWAGLLVPSKVTHVLKVCLIADKKYRIQQAMNNGLSEKEAIKEINDFDEGCINWSEHLFDKDPWHSSLYDIVLPTDKKTIDEAVQIVTEYVQKDILKPTDKSIKAIQDFRLAAQVEVALASEGHNVTVDAEDGVVILTIEKNVIMLSKLEQELKDIVSKLPGVKDVKTKIGPNFYQTDIYRKFDFERPSKVLLVDDEREFVQTLSERLLMRDMGSAVVYDGEQALKFVQSEEPEVIVLDLKMPGINGIEVLRRIKKTHPNIEVIILTGHGSEKDRQTCMELGAFAYLQKPVDIELLTETMKKAYAKIKERKA